MKYPNYPTCKKFTLQKSLRNKIEKYIGLKDQTPQDGWQKYPRGEGVLTDVERKLYAKIHQTYEELMRVEKWESYSEGARSEEARRKRKQ